MHRPVSYKIMQQRLAAEVMITIWFFATISSGEMGEHKACFCSLGKEALAVKASRSPGGVHRVDGVSDLESVPAGLRSRGHLGRRCSLISLNNLFL